MLELCEYAKEDMNVEEDEAFSPLYIVLDTIILVDDLDSSAQGCFDYGFDVTGINRSCPRFLETAGNVLVVHLFLAYTC